LNVDLHNDPDLPQAWAPWFSHEYITYHAVRALDGLTFLPPVAVKPRPPFADKVWPVGPKHIDIYKESYQERRRLDPVWSFDYKKRNGDFALAPPSGKTIEPWKVLVIYSTEPDLYLDHDLAVHKNQKITGGSHGWRHMEFKVLTSTFGAAPKSFLVHQDFSGLAFENGNDYWGWRYLSRCGHYLADLGSPFHVKALPSCFLMKNIFSGQTLFRTASAVHQGYEVYVERRFREGFEPFGQALARGASEAKNAAGNVRHRLPAYMEKARKKHNEVFYFFLDQYGRDLLEVFSRVDPGGPTETASQTNQCSADAARVIFRDGALPALSFLDGITAGILEDVGLMLGMLFQSFAAAKAR
jgi:hypothetical protein